MYNSFVSKIINVVKWLPILKKRSAMYVINEELKSLAEENSALSPRIEAIRYLLRTL